MTSKRSVEAHRLSAARARLNRFIVNEEIPPQERSEPAEFTIKASAAQLVGSFSGPSNLSVSRTGNGFTIGEG
ncbi:hypothetical protein [Paraburkholderia susongensis]|uniref:hypothetical protein n=1 Tax=Paraburkholderia susongensis TaxID=1515439 RepID=UPI00117E5756|nr:hypothetical protein [Paraburkholderia susongensis]